jgi:menaquinone-dependent protoporphyrinogen oxidase
MARFLVAFASREGQTEKIAHHCARRLEDRGHISRLVDLAAGETEAGADDCDAAILAGSIHRGRHESELAAFIMRHAPALRQRPGAFLSISLAAASHDENERSAIDELVQGFLHEVGWQPEQVLLVAGAVHDRELNALERFVLHRIVDAHGVERHPSGDTELTDWAALDSFVDAFAALAVR